MSVKISGEIINVRPLGAELAGAKSKALMKTDSLEVTYSLEALVDSSILLKLLVLA
jgi:hypothetical protein